MVTDLRATMASLESESARSRHAAWKRIQRIAERSPELLMSRFDDFVRMLDHSNKLKQWGAIFVLSRLVRADATGKFEKIFDRFFEPIRGPVMITAGNIIRSAPRIAGARPRWADRIARKIEGVASARFQTAECRRIAIGHAILAMDELFPMLRDQEPALRFVRRQVKCGRPATRAKAAKFLKRYTSPTN